MTWFTTARARGFRRELSLLDATALGVGSIIGSGIYIVVGEAAKAGYLGALAAWVIAALLIAPIALAYALCSRVVMETGGDYVYVARGLGPVMGAVAGATMWVAYIYVIAAIARGVARYIVPAGSPSAFAIEALVAVSVIWVLTAVNILGVRIGGKLNTGLTIAKILPLIVFVVFVAIAKLAGRLPSYAETTVEPVAGLPYAISATLWAYLGFESASTPAEEVKKTSYICTAIILSIALVAGLYLAVAGAALAALPWNVLSEAKAPLMEAARAVGGPSLGGLVYAGAIISMIGCLAACILSNTRRGYALAADLILPRSFAELSERGVPAKMLILQGVAATVFAAVMDFVSLYLIADFASLIPYLLVAIALPALYRKYKQAISPAVLAVSTAAVGSSLLLMWMVASSEPETVAAGAVLAIAAAFVAGLRKRKLART